MARLNFNLKDYRTKAEVLAAVDRITHLSENTNLTGALRLVRLEVFDPNYQQRPNVDRIIVVMTDGTPNREVDHLYAEVDRLRNMSVRIVGLGVTDWVFLTTSSLYSVNNHVSVIVAGC